MSTYYGLKCHYEAILLRIVGHPKCYSDIVLNALCFISTGNGVLAYCDVAGQLGTLVNCYGIESGNNEDDVEMVERADGMILKILLILNIFFYFVCRYVRILTPYNSSNRIE